MIGCNQICLNLSRSKKKVERESTLGIVRSLATIMTPLDSHCDVSTTEKPNGV